MLPDFGYEPDKRADNLFMMSSFTPTLIAVGLYLITVNYLGPLYMKGRKAYDLKNVLIVYNVVQIVANTVIFYLSINSGWLTKFSYFKCQEINYSTTDIEAMRAFYAIYIYFLVKFTEFLDTIFFILRKKDNQVSFLHVYHHSQMPIFTFMGMRYFAGGGGTLGTGLNSLIHIIMYAYYLLAALGPNVQKYLWWKKYLTSLQLLQFVVGIGHMIVSLTGNCKSYSKPLLSIGLVYVLSLIILFRNFYKESYENGTNEVKNMNGAAKHSKNGTNIIMAQKSS